MTWWTSIVFYLWRNSLRRWIEQPLSFLSKLLIAALIGTLGGLLVIASSFLGSELQRRLSDSDTRIVVITETVGIEEAASSLGETDPEEEYWRGLSEDSFILYQAPSAIRVEGRKDVMLCALRNPEDYGYLNTLLFLTERYEPGRNVIVEIDEYKVSAMTAKPRGLIKTVSRNRDVVLGSVEQLSPLMARGFARVVVLRADSLVEMEKAHEVSKLLQLIERRQVFAQSGLKLLQQIAQIQTIQTYILWAVTVGSSLVLGLICGALAWMEFREERYLLSLIRSFGVGRGTLLIHSVLENCLLSVAGVLLGFGALQFAAHSMDLSQLKLSWMGNVSVLLGLEGKILILGGFFGGLLSCVPIAIGLRKPLGLILK